MTATSGDRRMEEEKRKEDKAKEKAEVVTFLNDSSLHGVKYLSPGTHVVTRIIWGIFVITAAVYIGINLQKIIKMYRMYPVRNNIRTLAPNQLQFPTVTICDRNIMMRQKAQQLNEVLMAVGPYLMMAMFQPDTSGFLRNAAWYDWSDPAIEAFNQQMGEGTAWVDILHVVSPRLNDILQSCKWRGQLVDCSTIFTEVITHHGMCLRFNPGGNMTTNSAGTPGGLELDMRTAVDQYYLGPKSTSSGFMVAIHDKDFTPNFNRDLIDAPNGFATNIKVRRQEILKLPYPADNKKSDCIDTADPKYVNPLAEIEVPYSASACMLQCELEYINNTCGCYIFINSPTGKSDMRACDFKQILMCGLDRVDNFTTDPEGIESCSCPDRCHKTTYSTSSSMSVYPSYYLLSTLLGEPEEGVWRFNKTSSYFVENMVQINIFFDQLEYTFIEQEYEYPPEKVLCDCGGTMGILLGASLMSIIEFIQFIISLCIHSCNKKRQNRRVNNASIIMVQPSSATTPPPAYGS